jgi:hypothetical protein
LFFCPNTPVFELLASSTALAMSFLRIKDRRNKKDKEEK